MFFALFGLPPELEPFQNQILVNSLIQNFDDASSQLLRLSALLVPLSKTTSINSSVLASQKNERRGCGKNCNCGPHSQCTYYNKIGHTKDQCYSLPGRPPCTANVAHTDNSGDMVLNHQEVQLLMQCPYQQLIIMHLYNSRQPNNFPHL